MRRSKGVIVVVAALGALGVSGVLLGMIARSALCAGPWVCEPSAAAATRDLRRCLPGDAQIFVDEVGARSADLGYTALVTDGEPLSTCLVGAYERAGWRQRRTNWLNPRTPTSFDSGWREGPVPHGVIVRAADGTLDPGPTSAAGWLGEWESRGGDLVSYAVTITHYGDSTRDRLRAYAQFFPADEVIAARKTLRLRE